MDRNNKYCRCSTLLLTCYGKLNSHRQNHLLGPQCPSEAQALALKRLTKLRPNVNRRETVT